MGNVTYTLDVDKTVYPTEYNLIKIAMDSACWYYNRYTNFRGNVYVYYNAGIPTAQASYHGSLGFGPNSRYMWVGTAIHEMAHYMGSGTTTAWRAQLSGGVWQGATAKALLLSATGEVLKGDNNSNASAEGMIGTVNFDNKAGTLAIGDDVNLTVGAGGTQFVNGNNAILEFAGSSIITGVLGGNTAGNSTFEEIYAGADGKTVTFKNDVYVKESTFHVSGEGTVNFEGNLTGDLIYDADGVVNVSDGKNIIVSSSPVAVTTATTDTGSLNFLGTTLLATDIGTSTERLKNVTFGSAGSAANTYTQNLDKDIYAQNTYIGNGTNKTILEMKDDIIFGGSLTVRSN